MTTQPPDQPDPPDTIESGEDSRGFVRGFRQASRSRQGLLAFTAAVALVVAVASGAALAGDGSDETGRLAVSAAGSASPSPGDGDGGVDGFRGRGHAFGHGFRHGAVGGALHGTFVVPDGDGGYRTVMTQRGEVTAVSETSLTVKSEDGFVATYRLTDDTDVLGGPDGVGDIAKVDQVGVGANRTASVNTATHVVDLDQLGDFRRNHPGQPKPSSTATTEGTATRV